MTRLPQFITFTGVDRPEHSFGMGMLSYHYPIELGILFSKAKQGIDPRYPSHADIDLIIETATKFNVPLSMHLCGKYSRNVMNGRFDDLPLEYINYFRRVQINSRDPNIEAIVEFQGRIGKDCIVQSHGGSFAEDNRVMRLYDCSGGRGVSPELWPPHPRDGFVGYAGGICPENVVDVVKSIDAQDEYWIDMESGVRTDNVFDLKKCEDVCRSVYGT